MGRRLAPERRPRPPRRRGVPLDRREAEGDDHPGRAQRGARRGGGGALRTPRRDGGGGGRDPPCCARPGCGRLGGAPRRHGQRGAPQLPAGTVGRLQGAAPLHRAQGAPEKRERQGRQVPARPGTRTEERAMSPTYSTITYEEIGRVRRVTLNRPDHHNPLTPRCIREVLAAVDDAGSDPTANVLVIRSTGRSFSSGYGFIAEDTDPGDFPVHEAIEGDVSAMLSLSSSWSRVWDCPIPVI